MKDELHNFHDDDTVRTKSSERATTTCYYFPRSTNKPRTHQSCVNQQTNKQTTLHYNSSTASQNYPTLHETRRFNAVFTNVQHLYL